VPLPACQVFLLLNMCAARVRDSHTKECLRACIFYADSGGGYTMGETITGPNVSLFHMCCSALSDCAVGPTHPS
jgi:hypothetical protein